MKGENFNAKGFTIIELLTVIGIILVLAGLLMPALGKARRISQRARCASNLHQIGIALHLYANDNDGNFPTRGSWGMDLYPRYIDNEQVFDCPSHSGVGSARTPNYWYSESTLSISNNSTERMVGCYGGIHDGLENKLCVDGSVIMAPPGE